MKKIIAVISLALALCLSVAAFSACGNDLSISVIAPTGAPFAALADMWDEDLEGTDISYEVITESTVRTKMLSGEAEFIVAPLNIGNAVHTAYKDGNTEYDYKLLNVTSWGVLYFVTNDESYKARSEFETAQEFLAQFDGKPLYTIGEGAIPGLTAEYLVNAAGADVTWDGHDADFIQQKFVSAKADDTETVTAVFAQPAITAVTANATKPVRELGSVSEIYKELTGNDFPMAGMFVRGDFYDAHKDIVERVDARVKTSVEKFNSDINAVVEKIKNMDDAPLPAAILPKAYSKMNVEYKSASDSKAAVEKLFESINIQADDSLFV